MHIRHFMRHGYFLCLTLTSCILYTLMRDKHFMQAHHFYECRPLHVSYSLLWNNFTSWDSVTLMYTKHFMWTCKYCTLMWNIHFMTEVNFYGLPLLHGSKTPLCAQTTSCKRVAFMSPPYFIHTLYFNGDPLLHEIEVPLRLRYTSWENHTFMFLIHFMRLHYFYEFSILHVSFIL